jgi:hypothetical protein
VIKTLLSSKATRFLANVLVILTVYVSASQIAPRYGIDTVWLGSIILLVIWILWTEHRITALEGKHTVRRGRR